MLSTANVFRKTNVAGKTRAMNEASPPVMWLGHVDVTHDNVALPEAPLPSALPPIELHPVAPSPWCEKVSP